MVDVPGKVIALFEELIARGEKIKDACKKMYFSGTKKAIDAQDFEAWRTSCLTLLRSTFGTSSPHYDSFINLKFFDHYNSTLLYLGILQSAKDDLRKGYFYYKDLMLSVNIFTSFLAHAQAFARKGEDGKALAIMETVLRDALRKLSEVHGNAMSPDLGLEAAADALAAVNAIPDDVRSRIVTLAGITNGGSSDIPGDFDAWMAWVQKFLYDYLGSRIVIVN
jgi:hypothetical protein